MGFMKAEVPFDPESLKSDEERFAEIDQLLAEGWQFKGNFFDKDQTYRLVISKKDEERIFRPSAWTHFGTHDPEGGDYRACAGFGRCDDGSQRHQY